jgi:Ser/Thr protein kinase RdoA (MazF antagonist)
MPAPISPAAFAKLNTKAQLARVEKLVRQALPLYGLSHDSEVKLLSYSENATYLIRSPGQPPRVLRINRPGYHPRANIASELAWVEAIRRDTPIVTAEPIPSLDGEYIQLVWHPSVPEPRNCVLFSFVDGGEPDDSNRVAAFELLGEVTAQLHKHVLAWKAPRAITRHVWDFDAMLGEEKPLWGDWKKGLGMTPQIRRHLEKLVTVLRSRVEEFGTGPKRFGLVHADLRAANLLVKGDRISVIDFDDCGFSWYIYDLAAALSFIETHPDVPAYVAAWLKGYGKVRKLPKEDLAMIDTFIMLRRMLLVAWIGSHHDTLQAQAMGAKYTADTCMLAERYLKSQRALSGL